MRAHVREHSSICPHSFVRVIDTRTRQCFARTKVTTVVGKQDATNHGGASGQTALFHILINKGQFLRRNTKGKFHHTVFERLLRSPFSKKRGKVKGESHAVVFAAKSFTFNDAKGKDVTRRR